MIKQGVWRTRGGVLVAVEGKRTLGYVGPQGPGHVDVWVGRCLDCGARFTWELDGHYSPVQRHDLDLWSKSPSSAHGHVAQRCKKSHFTAQEVSGKRKKK